MNQGFRKFHGRVLCLAVFLGSLPLIGCGSSTSSKSGETIAIPPSVQESNNAMQDFMKSQPKGVKKR